MKIIETLPEEAELDFRMRYSDNETVKTFFFSHYETISLTETTLRGYVECKDAVDVVAIDVEGKKFLPWRSHQKYGEVIVAINECDDEWWNFANGPNIDFERWADKDIYLISTKHETINRLIFSYDIK